MRYPKYTNARIYKILGNEWRKMNNKEKNKWESKAK